MPKATYPQQWDLQFVAVLQKKIGAAVRQRIGKFVVDKGKLLAAVDNFLKRYRENLRASSTIQHLQIPSLTGPMGGYTSKSAATSNPLWGMIGIPKSRISTVTGIISKIRLGDFANFRIQETSKGVKGFLEIDFANLKFDADAQYHDGKHTISWVDLVEYGFAAPGYLYLRKNAGRSGYGLMGQSGPTGINFEFAGTHVFEDTFYETLAQTPPEDLLVMSIVFTD